jgi:hypothetical protein
MVEHEILKAKLRAEFDRLNITDEKLRDALTVEVNLIASLIIQTCPTKTYGA